MKSRVLFVGDLSELQESLERMDYQWDMVFMQNGSEALNALSNSAFDVVVADMRISGLTSVDLFTHISEQHPQIIRMMLIGENEQASLVQSAAPIREVLEPDLPITNGTKANSQTPKITEHIMMISGNFDRILNLVPILSILAVVHVNSINP